MEINHPLDGSSPTRRPFHIGDRVGAKLAVRERMRRAQASRGGDPEGPTYGHVVVVLDAGRQSLIWVQDHLGGEWALPEHELEHID